jgi:redox-sensitive bicupin YhaK (pirin superfamily)
MSIRPITRILAAQATQDGAGVRLLRALGHQHQSRFDPFLMLDAFSSDDPNDYIAGFPAHPHRGFETITYIVDGHMRHRDHLGNEGDLRAGGVQWMMAGSGIIHEEMPQQENGLLRGFQIWLNLPAATKMQAAHYRDIPAVDIPVRELERGGFAKLIAGTLRVADEDLVGPGQSEVTEPIIADIRVAPGDRLELPVPATHQAMLYVFEGWLAIEGRNVESAHSVLLGEGSMLRLGAGDEGARVLLLAGRPLNEPIAQYGPFVMNTQAEIEQALRDYRNGVLGG